LPVVYSLLSEVRKALFWDSHGDLDTFFNAKPAGRMAPKPKFRDQVEDFPSGIFVEINFTLGVNHSLILAKVDLARLAYPICTPLVAVQR
jgi:hypothetical protein